MLPHCVVNSLNNNNNKVKKSFFKCANDYAAPCQLWHACLGLPTPDLYTHQHIKPSLLLPIDPLPLPMKPPSTRPWTSPTSGEEAVRGQQQLGGGADLGLSFRELEEGELFVGGPGLQRYLQGSQPTLDLHVHWRGENEIGLITHHCGGTTVGTTVGTRVGTTVGTRVGTRVGTQ